MKSAAREKNFKHHAIKIEDEAENEAANFQRKYNGFISLRISKIIHFVVTNPFLQKLLIFATKYENFFFG